MQKSLLFSALKLGDLTLKNRVAFASLTRARADPKTGVPSDIHVDYYSQRAGAGLIFSESSQTSADNLSYPGAAGIHTDEQVAGWKRVTDAVHKAGSLIFLQLFHGGRAAPKETTGIDPIAPSPIATRGNYPGANGMTPHTVPREMNKDDFKIVLENYRKAAQNAKRAGFDGVELHAAFGFLIATFLTSSTNKRTDEYGGSAENRVRFPLEVIDQLIDVFGPERVGMKISPVSRSLDMYDENPLETYKVLLEGLNKRNVAFIQVVEANDTTENGHPLPKDQMPLVSKTLRPYFKGKLIANGAMTKEKAEKFIQDGWADAVAFGTHYISNPDLAQRFENNWPLSPVNWATARLKTAEGYNDYPPYKAPETTTKESAQPAQ